MKKLLAIAAISVLLALLAALSVDMQPTPELSPQSYHPLYVVSERPTETPTATSTLTPTATNTATPTNTPTSTPTPIPGRLLKGVSGITQVFYGTALRAWDEENQKWYWQEPEDAHERACALLYATGAEIMQDWSAYIKYDCPDIQVMCQYCSTKQMATQGTLPALNERCKIVATDNEPQVPAQAYDTPENLASRWPGVAAWARALGVEFTAPCTDLTYMDSFYNSHWDQHGYAPEFDYMCVHSYPMADAQTASNQVIVAVTAARDWSVQKGYSGEVVLHEWGMYPGVGNQAEFVRLTLPRLADLGVLSFWYSLSMTGEYTVGADRAEVYAQYYDTDLVKLSGGVPQLTAIGQAFK